MSASTVIRKAGHVRDRVRLDHAYLDFDTRRVPRLRPIWAVCRIVGLRPRSILTRRSSRRGWHVIVRLDRAIQPAELVALQFAFGSDRRRETLNLCRVLGMRESKIRDPFWQVRWNLLYERKLQCTSTKVRPSARSQHSKPSLSSRR